MEFPALPCMHPGARHPRCVSSPTGGNYPITGHTREWSKFGWINKVFPHVLSSSFCFLLCVFPKGSWGIGEPRDRSAKKEQRCTGARNSPVSGRADRFSRSLIMWCVSLSNVLHLSEPQFSHCNHQGDRQADGRTYWRWRRSWPRRRRSLPSPGHS